MLHKAQEHVLITGATGLVGRAAVEHFAKAGYRTTAISRRTPFDLYGANFMSVDLADRAACEGAFGKITNCTRIVFAAVEDQADLVAGWLDQAHIDRNGLMLRNMVDVVSAGSPSLKHVTILQGPKAYGAHVKPIRPDSREIRDDVRDIPNFYWPQQDYLAERGGAAGRRAGRGRSSGPRWCREWRLAAMPIRSARSASTLLCKRRSASHSIFRAPAACGMRRPTPS